MQAQQNNVMHNIIQLIGAAEQCYEYCTTRTSFYKDLEDKAYTTYFDSMMIHATPELRTILQLYQGEILIVDRLSQRVETLVVELKELDPHFRSIADRDIQIDTNLYAEDAHHIGSEPRPSTYVQRIFDQFHALIIETAKAIQPWPIHPILNYLSSTRKQRYNQLLLFRLRIQRLNTLTKEQIRERARVQHEQDSRTNNALLNQALDDTTDLIVQIKEEAAKEIEACVLELYKSQLPRFTADNFVANLTELSKLEYSPRSITTTFRRQMNVGSIIIDITKYRNIPTLSETIDDLLEETCNGYIIVPLVIHPSSSMCVVKSVDSSQNKQLTQLFFERTLLSSPANKHRFTICDLNRTDDFQQLLPLQNAFPNMFGSVITQSGEIKAKLKQHLSHIDSVKQHQLSTGFTDIDSYNDSATYNQTERQTIIILDFPYEFDRSMLDDLLQIIKNGQPAGVNAIIFYNEELITDTRLFNDANLAIIKEIFAITTNIYHDDKQWFMHDVNAVMQFKPADVLNEYDVGQLIETYKSATTPVKLDFTLIRPTRQKTDSLDDIEIPIGFNNANQVQSITFGNTQTTVGGGFVLSAFVTGSSGSGKSTLLQTIIMSMLTGYTHDAVHLYLLDFKRQGTEFEIYTKYNIPHIQVIGLDCLQEHAKTILEELVIKMDERAVEFAKYQLRNITDFNRDSRISTKMPRIVLIIDEFVEMFSNNNKRIANNSLTLMNKLTAQGRAYGIHIILATQTISRITTGTDFVITSIDPFNEFHMRIALQNTDHSEYRKLFKDDTKGTHAQTLISQQGKGFVALDLDYRTSNPLIGVRVAVCQPADQTRMLQALNGTAIGTQTRIYDTTTLPKISASKIFVNRPSDQFIMMGQPIGNTDLKIAVGGANGYRTNLVCVGSNEATLTRFADTYVINASQNIRVLGKGEVYYFESSETLSPHTQRIILANKCVSHVSENSSIYGTLIDIHQKLQQRQRNLQVNLPIYLVFKRIALLTVLDYALQGLDIDLMIGRDGEFAASSSPKEVDVEVEDDISKMSAEDLLQWSNDFNANFNSSMNRALPPTAQSYAASAARNNAPYRNLQQALKDIVMYGPQLQIYVSFFEDSETHITHIANIFNGMTALRSHLHHMIIFNSNESTASRLGFNDIAFRNQVEHVAYYKKQSTEDVYQIQVFDIDKVS